jgi:diguanylate cyclase (GGDEF)-like protein
MHDGDPLLLVCDHLGSRPGELADHLNLRGYRTAHAQNLRESLESIGRERPALLVMRPLVAGGRAELETIEQARQGEPPIPLLVVSDRKRSAPLEAAASVLRTGAWDVIYADTPPEELALRVSRLETEVGRLREMSALRHQASHDDRTDLLRVHAVEARLREHFSAAQRHSFDVALVLIDLDRFGLINKRHDHTVGDAIIAQVGEVIRRCLRAEDAAGRLGGDEFGVVLPYTRKVDAASVVGRLRDEIHKLSGRPPGARSDVEVGASIGFETFDGSDLDSVATLRTHTERALREAKRRGGNQGVYYRSIARADGDGA